MLIKIKYQINIENNCTVCYTRFGVKEIRMEAFNGCNSLIDVNIPNTVNKIENYVFSNCTSLKSIEIPDSVKILGDDNTYSSNIFFECKNLENVTLPRNIHVLNKGFFKNCESLKSITIPNSVYTIGDAAFLGCKSLTNIVIPNSVKEIGSGAFSDCTNLKDIKMSKNILSLSYSIFDNTYCYKGKLDADSVLYLNNDTIGIADDFYFNIDVSGDIDIVLPESLICIGSDAIGKIDLIGLGSSSLKSINLPSNLKYICSEGFSYCSEAKGSLSIPKSVEYIGDKAFYNCGFNTIKVNNKDCIVMDKAFGYDLIGYGHILKKDFKLYGYSNSTADTYAKENGITFVVLDKKTNPVIKATSVKLNKNTLTLNRKNVNVSAQLIGKVVPNNATNSKLSWKSSNTKVVTVARNGKIIGKSRGTAKITVTTTDGSNVSATCNVTVKQLVTSVKLNKRAISLKAKGKAKQKTYTLKATVTKNANNKKVKWTTSNKKVAVVNSKGKVTAKKKGTCYISVTSTDGSRKSAKLL